ncbi:MAG: hypothetical protein WD875_02710 [Pirellulales bacterium]
MQPRSYHVSIASPAGFAVSFEQAAAALESLERMFFEPDGSFVWTENRTATVDHENGPSTDEIETSWQIDGVLYDRGGRLAYVEIKGNAPADAINRLLPALGWPEARLTFQLMREGVVLDEVAFRQWLAGE